MKYRKNLYVGIVKNHVASQELIRHNINPNKVHQDPRNCNTRDPENVAKTRDQSVSSDLSESVCTTEKMVNKKNKRTLEP